MSISAIKGRIVMATLGVFSGTSAGIIFLWKYENLAVFLLGLFSAVLAAQLIYICAMFINGKLYNWPNCLFHIIVMLNGSIAWAANANMCVFLAWAAAVAEPMISKGNNKWMVAVWSFMVLKWSFSTVMVTLSFSKQVTFSKVN